MTKLYFLAIKMLWINKDLQHPNKRSNNGRVWEVRQYLLATKRRVDD